jgi:DNA repair exonuclease SbcCD ATPase subunit
LDIVEVVMLGFGGSLFILSTVVLFLVFAVMLMIRTLMLVFLVMVSPWPFLSYAFNGNLTGSAKKWWDELICQTYWLPVSMMLFWVSLRVLNGGRAVFTAITAQSPYPGGNLILQAVFFVMAIGMLYVSLIIGKTLGCGGAGKITAWGEGKIKGFGTNSAAWLGRNTLGRGATAVANSRATKGALNLASKVPLVGDAAARAVQSQLKGVAGMGFGGAKGGFLEAQKAKQKSQEEFGKYLEKGIGIQGKKSEEEKARDKERKLDYADTLERQATGTKLSSAILAGATAGGVAGPGGIVVGGVVGALGGRADAVSGAAAAELRKDENTKELEDRKKELKKVREKLESDETSDEDKKTLKKEEAELVEEISQLRKKVGTTNATAAPNTATSGASPAGGPRASFAERVATGTVAGNLTAGIKERLGGDVGDIASVITDPIKDLREKLKAAGYEFGHLKAAVTSFTSAETRGSYTQSFKDEANMQKEVAQLDEDIQRLESKTQKVGFGAGIENSKLGEMRARREQVKQRLESLQADPMNRVQRSSPESPTDLRTDLDAEEAAAKAREDEARRRAPAYRSTTERARAAGPIGPRPPTASPRTPGATPGGTSPSPRAESAPPTSEPARPDSTNPLTS